MTNNTAIGATTGDWQPDMVIYHDNCADGFGAAWACWMRWGDACEYVPANYGQVPPDVTGKNILIVDFSYKRPELETMANAAASIVILDHHKTAQAELEPFAFRESSPGAISPDDVSGIRAYLAAKDPTPANDERLIAGRTLEGWRQLARRDDCFDQMVPSDLRLLLAEIR